MSKKDHERFEDVSEIPMGIPVEYPSTQEVNARLPNDPHYHQNQPHHQQINYNPYQQQHGYMPQH